MDGKCHFLCHTALRKYDYGIVHYDSPDKRGIDCALLYRKSRVKVLRSSPRYLGGISDHLPIVLEVILPANNGTL